MFLLTYTNDRKPDKNPQSFAFLSSKISDIDSEDLGQAIAAYRNLERISFSIRRLPHFSTHSYEHESTLPLRRCLESSLDMALAAICDNTDFLDHKVDQRLSEAFSELAIAINR